MTHHSTNDKSIQLSLPFDTPHPLIVADKWGFPLAYINTNGNPDDYLYACADWFVGLGGYKTGWWHAKKQLTNAVSKFNLQSAPYKAANGKTYRLDFTDAKGLYLIAGNMKPAENRPQLDEIKEYLATAGVILDVAKRDPAKARQLAAELYRKHGKSDKWIEQRLRGIEKRNALTEAARDTHATQEPDYAGLTNITYTVILGAVKSALVKRLGLSVTQARNFRDHLSRLALHALEVAEDAAEYKMRDLGRGLTDSEQSAIVQDAAEFVAPRFQEIAAYMGIDLVTGNRLIEGKS